METGIHIGNKIDAKEAVGPVAQAVVSVLQAINEQGIDRETGIKALEVVSMAAGVHGASISNCNISGGPRPEPREIYDTDDDA